MRVLREELLRKLCRAKVEELEFLHLAFQMPPRPGCLPPLTTTLIPEGDPMAGVQFSDAS